ncbi:MAG: DNA translocase FtsK [Thermodesulfovibrionales bacterium]|nr:DNA translocase FtsK [Thermodesulfovibrionales bacterium]
MAESVKYITSFDEDKPQSFFSSRKFQYIKGVIALLGSIYMAISLFTFDIWDKSILTFSNKPISNYGGVVGSYLADGILAIFGFPGYLIPLFVFIWGLRRILNIQRNLLLLFGTLLFFLSLPLLIQLITKYVLSYNEHYGGLIGYLLTNLFVSLLSTTGAFILSIACLIISLILITPFSIFKIISKRNHQNRDGDDNSELREKFKAIDVKEESTDYSKVIRQTTSFQVTSPPKSGDYLLPPLELLANPEQGISQTKDEINLAIAGLEKKLSDFGIKGRIRQANPGPVVTMYEFEPAAGVKINRIVSLSDDLALALRAPSIRVYPIAGKAAIGIEVPNKRRAIVYLREIMASDSFQKSNSLLTLALGKDIFGNPVVTDLTRMPHLLVAGATGSGKSIFINTLILSILYKASPSDVKMLLVDPKLLELSAYADIPHLIAPVITNPKEASVALQKMVLEMERRYKLLADRGAKSIENFNRELDPSERLPYIVVFIDELADLMFTAPADVENAITRLAQMARASGIHLILATQRPSVDVITGLIKANFPARISFQLTTKVDSRTILDSQGAEQLLGMGDMLFMIPGAKIMRIHGAYVSEREVTEITQFIRDQKKPDYTFFQNIKVLNENLEERAEENDRDEIYYKVIEYASSLGEVSISSIQRRFKIGYNRAARIMELLEEDGLVGPPKGAGKPRDFIPKR